MIKYGSHALAIARQRKAMQRAGFRGTSAPYVTLGEPNQYQSRGTAYNPYPDPYVATRQMEGVGYVSKGNSSYSPYSQGSMAQPAPQSAMGREGSGYVPPVSPAASQLIPVAQQPAFNAEQYRAALSAQFDNGRNIQGVMGNPNTYINAQGIPVVQRTPMEAALLPLRHATEAQLASPEFRQLLEELLRNAVASGGQ